MRIFHGNDHGCLLNKKVVFWCPYQHIQRAPKSYAAPLSYADLSDFYTRDFLLWFSTSNISAPFDWKIPKIGMGNHTNPINKVFLWSMAEIPTMSENKARESGIFGFPWFQPCLFSQKRWGAETWPGNIELRVVIGESPKKISWSSDIGQQRYGTWKTAKIAIFRVSYLSSPLSELHEIFFGDSPLTHLNVLFYGSYPGTSPNLRKKTWLKPWNSKNGPFSGLNLRCGWDFRLGP